jgi:hypothetical protein
MIGYPEWLQHRRRKFVRLYPKFKFPASPTKFPAKSGKFPALLSREFEAEFDYKQLMLHEF